VFFDYGEAFFVFFFPFVNFFPPSFPYSSL